jgi:ketosteroid isomerase-like protein
MDTLIHDLPRVMVAVFRRVSRRRSAEVNQPGGKVMKYRSPLLLCLFVTLALSAPMEGSAQQEHDAVRQALTDFHAALAAGDSVTALAQLAPDARIIEGGGVQTREEYRSHHLPGDMAFAAAVTRERSDISVDIRGNMAWAYSTSRTKGEIRGRKIDSRGAELAVLVKIGGVWKIVAIQWS